MHGLDCRLERAVWADFAGREPNHRGAELPSDHPLCRDQGDPGPCGCDVQRAGLRVIRTRTFNIVGPRQKANFVSSAFAKQIAEIERGLRSPLIEVGNLAARRDFVDVRDVVRAYGLALTHGRPGAVYNVCSGKERSVANYWMDCWH